ncbi:MAG: DNA alkylation repair protein [Lachnospiraceae bacterium]|nr:DNA alkylation repair protein [Lachnospiraceae bacterium]
MTVYERLLEVKDDTYKEFQSKLVPNIDGETILGVRTPDMRNIAKEVFGTSECERFLKDIPHKYYEENLVHMFLIGRIKNFDECVKATDEFLPYVDCWPVSDQSSPNVFKKNHEKLLPYIKRWIDSDHVYTSRFGMRILMNEFLDSDFKDEYLGLVAAKTGEDYYLKMMVAWYFATALAKQYDASIKYFEGKVLDPWTHKKAIQKAIESYRVTDEHKEYLRSLK